jgi:death-on-curing protein
MHKFIDTLNPELAYLYSSACAASTEFHNQYQAGDLSIFEVLRAHFCLVDHFEREGDGEGIGGAGVKDQGMLISALSRQYVGLGATLKWGTVHEKAATLMFGLVKNHSFYDANKRTAYLSTVHYLNSNGYMIEATEKELEDLTVWVANNELNRFSRFKDLQKKGSDPEVRFLAYFLRRKTRKVDRTQYHVTYRELEKLLKKYDVWLESPSNNSIDVMHWVDVEVPRTSFLRKRRYNKEIRRAFCLGFPGWNKQVGKGRLGYLRKELKLTPEYGVDSQSFFRDVDDMRVLLGMHEGALRRLAYR